MKSLFFHVGAHKTGSSFLQNTLAANQPLLQDHGIAYLHKYDLTNSPYFRHLMSVWGKDLEKGVPIERATEAFRTLIDAPDESTVLLSHENFLGTPFSKAPLLYPFAEEVLSAIMAIAGDHGSRVLLCIRNQADFIESIFMQRAMKGKRLDFAAYFEKRGYTQLSWLGLARRIRDVVGPERFLIMPFEIVYEDSEDFVRRFLGLCGAEVREPLTLSDERNPSFSDAALKIAAFSAEHLRPEERKLLKVFLQKHVSGGSYGRARLLHEPERGKLIRHFSEENETLFREFVEPGFATPAVLERYLAS